jgi:hypothetical protein
MYINSWGYKKRLFKVENSLSQELLLVMHGQIPGVGAACVLSAPNPMSKM